MNAKKGLVALAVASAFASSAAMAKGTITVGNGYDDGAACGATPSAFTINGVVFAETEALMLANEEVSIDAVLAGNEDSQFRAPLCNVTRTDPAHEDYASGDISIAYATDIELPNQATFTMTVSGTAGAFNTADATNLKLITFNQDGDAVVVGKVIDYDTAEFGSEDVELAHKVQFEIRTDAIEAPASGATPDDNMFLSAVTGNAEIAFAGSSEPLPGNVQIYVANQNNQPIHFTVAEGSTGSASVKFDNFQASSGTNLGAAASNTALLAQIADPAVMKVATATSVINANPTGTVYSGQTSSAEYDENGDWTGNRNSGSFYDNNMPLVQASRFVTEMDTSAEESDTPYTWRSVADVYLETYADIGMTAAAGDRIKLVMERNVAGGEDRHSGVDRIFFGTDADGNGGVEVRQNPDNPRFWGQVEALSNVGINGVGEENSTYLTISANGSEQLYPVVESGAFDWTLFKLEYQLANDSENWFELEADYSLNDSTHYWTMNGTQFKVPNISYVEGDASSSVVKIANDYTRPAYVTFTAIVTDAEGSETLEYTGEDFVIGAESHLLVDGAAIADALGLEGSNYEMTVDFNVTAPQNHVHATVESQTGEDVIGKPVLYKTNNKFDGRQWQ